MTEILIRLATAIVILGGIWGAWCTYDLIRRWWQSP